METVGDLSETEVMHIKTIIRKAVFEQWDKDKIISVAIEYIDIAPRIYKAIIDHLL